MSTHRSHGMVMEKQGKESNEKISRRVNDLLTIRYLQDTENSSTYSHSPSYTHQLFDQEIIALDEQSLDLQIDLEIYISDLRSSLRISNASDEIKLHITQQITPYLTSEPSEFKFHESHAPQKVFDLGNGTDEKFEMYLMTYRDRGASELLKRAEKIALFYIETASSIDFEDDKWEVLFLIKRDSLNQTAFIGYYTLYTFHNPFLGSKLRICQVLILPPFQGHGLGKQMLSFIYSLVQSRPHVTEITVEDPAESFQNLRDLVDLEWSLGHPNLSSSQELKIIPSQFYFIQNAIEFHDIQSLAPPEESPEEEERETKKRSFDAIIVSDENSIPKKVSKRSQTEFQQKMKEFRLRNKRYLLQQNGDLKGLEKAVMQKELGELYECLEKRYQRVHRRGDIWKLWRQQEVCEESGVRGGGTDN
jgi:GNAT superfamily N-acetyltransferase